MKCDLEYRPKIFLINFRKNREFCSAGNKCTISLFDIFEDQGILLWPIDRINSGRKLYTIFAIMQRCSMCVLLFFLF